jgi:HTH-type transcriptional regulator / antitoxin HipB
MEICELGEVVRDARRKHGFTQGQLADLAGVGRNTISAIENGTYEDLGIRKIERICTVLHLELSVGPVSYSIDHAADAVEAANEADRKIEEARKGIRR